MMFDPAETRLIEARQLRDAARAIVRTDLATLQLSLAERPLTERARDSAVTRATGLAHSTLDLAMASRGVFLLTLTAVAGWLFRKRLGAIAQAGWAAGTIRLANWRAARAQTKDF